MFSSSFTFVPDIFYSYYVVVSTQCYVIGQNITQFHKCLDQNLPSLKNLQDSMLITLQ